MDRFLSTIYFAFNAVAPILLLILLGYFARRKNLLTEEFLIVANRFNFRFGISFLLFTNVYALDKLSDIPVLLALLTIVALFAVTLLGFVVANVATDKNARKGVLMQASFRSNYAIIGVMLAESLAGAKGVAMAGALQAPGIIFFNLMSVICMSIYSDQEQSIDVRKIVKGIVTNPLIIALALGVVALAIRPLIPVNAAGQPVFSLSGSLPWLYSAMQNLGKMASPLALIVLGGQFSFTDVKDMKKELAAGCAVRLIGAPIVGFAMMFAFHAMGLITLDNAAIAVLIALFGSPAAVNSVVMAAEMGADDKLAGQLVVWTSVLNTATIFVQVVMFRLAGLI